MERFSSSPGCLVIWVFSSSKLSPFALALLASSLESRASSYRAVVSSSSCISLNFIPFSSTQAFRTAFNSLSLIMPSPSLARTKDLKMKMRDSFIERESLTIFVVDLEETADLIFVGFATKLLHSFTEFSQRNAIASALVENAEDALGKKRLSKKRWNGKKK